MDFGAPLTYGLVALEQRVWEGTFRPMQSYRNAPLDRVAPVKTKEDQ
jgi:hypothetical protein